MTDDREMANGCDPQRLMVAADWLIRLRDDADRDDGESDVLIEWLQWYEADPRNQQAFDHMQDLWNLSDGLADEVVDGELNVRARTSHATASGRPAGVRRAFAAMSSELLGALRSHSRGLSLGVVAGLMIALALVPDLHLDHPQSPSLINVNDYLANARHPPALAKLADGSYVELAAKSEVAVHYTRQLRAIHFRSGEAFFKVAHNKHRPFVVSVGPLKVRAVGTAFNIREAADRIVVTVAEGTVDVKQYHVGATGQVVGDGEGEKPVNTVQISAGDQVTWVRGTRHIAIADVDTSSVLAWRQGRMEYSDEPLKSVIADVNRYSDRPVVIEGKIPDDVNYSGSILTKYIGEWVRALPSAFPVQLTVLPNKYVITIREKAHS